MGWVGAEAVKNKPEGYKMSKWITTALIVCLCEAVQAAEEGEKKVRELNKKQFVSAQRRLHEKKGLEFDQAKVEARFDQLDKNGDGKLSADERNFKKNK